MQNSLITYFNAKVVNIAKFFMIILFLALIRCIAEFYRLDHLRGDALSISEIRPFMLGALCSAIGEFVMALLYFFNRNKLVCFFGFFTLIALFIIKGIYL